MNFDLRYFFRLKRTLSLHITRIHINPKKNVKRKSLPQKNGSLEDINSQFKEIKNESENKTENAVEPKEEIIKNDISDYDGNDFNDYSR